MLAIRTFETMLQDLRLTSKYNGVEYTYSGPAHRNGIGQECAVGQTFALNEKRLHLRHPLRGHGRLIAKGLRTIRLLNDGQLEAIMEQSCAGAQLEVVRKGFSGGVKERRSASSCTASWRGKSLAARRAHGESGQFHARLLHSFGIYPNNAIVGVAPSPQGLRCSRRWRSSRGHLRGQRRRDGSVGCGPVWESMNFASMDQLHTLWDDKGGLPVLFNFVNNGYGMGGQTCGETMAFNVLARIGAGINPDQMHAERVDGFNVFAVIDGVRRKKELLLRGEGPALLDVVTYRFCGHSTSDANPNRTREEIDAWTAQDALADYQRQMLENGVMTAAEIEGMKEEVAQLNFAMFQLAVDPGLSPRMDLRAHPEEIEKHMFSNQRVPALSSGAPRVWGALEDNPRWKQVRKARPLRRGEQRGALSRRSLSDSRRDLRGDAGGLLPRPHAGFLRRGSARLGQRLRRVQGTGKVRSL